MRLLAFIVIFALAAGCVGERGPAGPQGLPGAAIEQVEGTINAQHYVYDPEWATLTNVAFSFENVSQVLLLNPQDTSWKVWTHYHVIEGALYIYDPNHTFVGWRYCILVVLPFGLA